MERCHCGELMYRWHKGAAWLCIYCGPYTDRQIVSPDIQAVMRGLADIDAGRTKPLEQVRLELGIKRLEQG